MSGPDFMDGNHSRVFVHADLGDLRGIGISRRRANARALECAASRVLGRCIRAGSAKSATEVNGGNDSFLKAHVVPWTLFLALLLERAAQSLAFYAPADLLHVGEGRICLLGQRLRFQADRKSV